MAILDAGFQTEAAVLSPGECEAVLSKIGADLRGGRRAGTRHLMSNEAVNELAHDPRFLKIARNALGSEAAPFRATLFAKSQTANWLIPWHQDTALPLAAQFEDTEWMSWSQKEGVHYAHAPAWALSRVVALRVHLDASSSDNGPLRVIPGSQEAGVLADEDVLDYVKSHESATCLVPQGGVLAMRPLLIHSSSKVQSDKPRRVLHIEYVDSIELKPGIHLAIA